MAKFVECPCCGKINIVKNGKDINGVQRYLCLNNECVCNSFTLDRDYVYLNPGITKINFRTVKKHIEYGADK